jgi:hypothetical protein
VLAGAAEAPVDDVHVFWVTKVDPSPRMMGSTSFRAAPVEGVTMNLIPAAVITLALATTLTGCGEDQPAVCSSVDDLETSFDEVRDINVSSSSALSDLESGLTAIGSDLSDVKADAKAEFSTQIDVAQDSYDALADSVEAAMANASVATLSDAATALSTFGGDVRILITDVQETC